MTDVLLKDHGMETAIGVRAPIDEEWKEAEFKTTNISVVAAKVGHERFLAFQSRFRSLLGLHAVRYRTSDLHCIVRQGRHTNQI